MTTLIAATLRFGDGRKVANVRHVQMELADRGFVLRAFHTTPNARRVGSATSERHKLTALEGRAELAATLRSWAALLEAGGQP